MKNTRVLIILLLPILFFQACSFCVECEGPLVIEERITESFDAIVVKGSADVLLVHSTSPFVEVTAQESLLEMIETRVEGSTLIVSIDGCYRSREALSIRAGIHHPVLAKVSGSGSIKGEEVLETEEIEIQVDGSGDIILHLNAGFVNAVVRGSGDILLEGACDVFEAGVKGSGDIKAEALLARKVTATVNGSGDARVNATESLEAKINGSGDIRYAGNPEDLETRVNGSGDIRKLR